MASVDASNACIPPSYPLVTSCPPLPAAIRGESLVVDGHSGRLNKDKSLLVYPSGKLVVVRDLSLPSIQAFCYRGHTAPVTVAKFSPSGAYIASGDSKGKLRVWSYDNEEHLAKLELQALNGPIRDLDWDFESKRIVIVGEIGGSGSSASAAENTRVIAWDVGTKLGTTGQHVRGRSSTCAFKPSRPMRIVTGGKDDSKLIFNAGPPFKRVVDGSASEDCHTKNGVTCVRYNHSGTMVVSVGGDKAIHLYDGKTLNNIASLPQLHDGTIYSCSWSSDDKYVMTCSADGTIKLVEVTPTSLKVVQTAHAVDDETASKITTTTTAKVPIGAMQVGCTFTKDDVPVSISLNGQITILPQPPILGGPEEGLISVLTGHVAPISGFAVDASRGYAYTGDTDGILCQWDIQTGRALKRHSYNDTSKNLDLTSKVHKGAISCLTLSPTTGNLFSAGWDDTLRISNSQGIVLDQDEDTTTTNQKLPAQPNAMSTGTNLTIIVTVEGLVLANATTGALVSDTLHPFGSSYNPSSVCMAKDDSTIYVGGDDCKIHIYNVEDNGRTIVKGDVYESIHLKPIHALALSPDGAKLASADVRDVCVTDLKSKETLVGKGRWCFHTQRITCLSWHDNGTYLASGGADDQVFIWNLSKRMKRIHYKFTHRGGVSGLAFLPSTSKLISVGADSCFNTWDVQADIERKF
mmetsp:Transcript_7829/g.11259  ORF Transcript_7829/g.11259 Transcript_7829/m.11259 type:complete len:691 (-) Transcript_7829:358-2430(-)